MDEDTYYSNSTAPKSHSTFFIEPDVDTHSCQLLGPTALIVQALMGVLVILSLVYKRHREKPMRPWRIWLFDVSKQVVGQMFVHGVNVLISDLVSHYTSNNACVFYFLNILVDTTLGVGLIYVILRLLTFIMTEKLHLKGFESGVYGTPPSFKYWLRQATIYVCALCTMKFLVIGLLALFPGLFTLGAWLLSWTYTDKGDALQVIFTMGVFPIIMNIVQFWLIDSIVKASGVALDLDAPDPLDREPLFGAPDEDDDETPRANAATDVESHPRRNISVSHSRSRSRSPSLSLRTPSESKLSGGSTPVAIEATHHAYPPSIASSAESSHAPVHHQPVLREAKKLGKPKRRGPPSPIHIQSNNPRAVNSPRQTPMTAPTSAARQPPPPVPVPAPVQESSGDDTWGESWDDSENWADKVGQEEWTGRRMEEKKGALSAWDTGSPLVNSLHVES